jgi:Ca2+-binding EF-hand superfamily protein
MMALLVAVPAWAQDFQSYSPWGGPQESPLVGEGDVFGQADADHNGRLTPDEAWAWVRHRFEMSDHDHDGSLTREEFNAPVQQPPRGNRAPANQARQRSTAAFRGADANRDGKLTLEELHPGFDAWFRTMDADQNGAITREELRPAPGR